MTDVRALVTGAAGMIGGKLTERLARDGFLGDRPLAQLVLSDVVAPAAPEAAFAVETVVADLAQPAAADGLVATRPDVIFHLAAVVSGEAEADLDKGYRVNLDGTRALFDAIRAAGGGYRPRLVLASSIAVFGAPLPDVIGDEQRPTPRTSYGTQKAIAELLLSDYTRRGIFDGIAIRLPTICVRPGAPNKAASGFFSSIIREPLNGREAILPVDDDVRHWHASPRAAVSFLLRAATIDTGLVGEERCLTMPGVSATVGEQIDALRRIAGDGVVSRIRREPDAAVARIVARWPGNFDPGRASALGFRAEADFDEIIRVHIEDELGGVIPGSAIPAAAS